MLIFPIPNATKDIDGEGVEDYQPDCRKYNIEYVSTTVSSRGRVLIDVYYND
jgi:hypothetical protein